MSTIEVLPDAIVKVSAGGQTMLCPVLDLFSDAGDKIAKQVFGSEIFAELISSKAYQQLAYETDAYWAQYESLYYAD